MIKVFKHLVTIFCAVLFSSAYADETITMNLISQSGPVKPVGTVTVSQTKYGLMILPNLSNLPPGLHGFHIHEKPDCANGGMAAGGHLDPKKTNKHLGPYNDNGHLGDLPILYVDKEGRATTPVVAPRVRLTDIKNRALMIHAGGDNYSDDPPMGGGGSRLVCGIIQS